MPLTARTPHHLPRLVMRRAAWVAAAVLLLAAVLGLARMAHDVDDEVAGARSLARSIALLASLPARDDAAALADLAALQAGAPMRHLTLHVVDAQQQVLLALPAGAALPPPEAPAERWTLARPSGAPWTVMLRTSAADERQEALVSLAGTMALLLLCVVGLLLVMRWNLARAFGPLQQLLAAIAGVERDDAAPLRALAPMPIQELEAIAGALRHLAASLEEAQARRRLLGQKVLTLQEDERAHLARELHDELGQRLTAMRVDAAWLMRKLPPDDERHAVVQGLAQQCEQIQADVRELLARLRPLGSVSPEGSAPEPLARLEELLRALVAGWNGAASRGARVALVMTVGDAQRALPGALLLGVYRLSQEALTNVARHAQATRCELRVALGADGVLAWSVEDDGVGLGDAVAAAQRGNGLAGMHERAWALGGELLVTPASDAAARPGLRLAARFSI